MDGSLGDVGTVDVDEGNTAGAGNLVCGDREAIASNQLTSAVTRRFSKVVLTCGFPVQSVAREKASIVVATMSTADSDTDGGSFTAGKAASGACLRAVSTC